MTDDTTVRLERTYAASPAQVYRAWLDPDLLRRWLGPGDYSAARAEVDARVGGRHRVWHVTADGTDVGGAEGVFVALVPDELIVLRWHFVGPDRTTPDELESLLTVRLRPGDAGNPAASTHLTLEHSRLGGLRAVSPEIADNVTVGWASVLDQLPLVLRHTLED